ncbi:MAG: hypothetical protein ACTHJ4_06605 [Candidatus Nucleicultricaceae bacterium]
MTRASLNRIVHIFFLFSLFLFPAYATLSASDDLVVDNITVASTDQSAPKAREIAILEAERKGLIQLAERQGLSLNADLLSQLEPAKIQQSVKALEIVKEKATATKYTGTFKITYKPTALQKLASASSTKKSLSEQSTSCVVLPLFKTGDHLELWGDQNPWFDVWTSVTLPASLVLPLGDLSDMKLFQAGTPLTFEKLKPLLAHYDSHCTFVTILKQEESGRFFLTNYKITAEAAFSAPEQRIEGGYGSALTAALTIYEKGEFSEDLSKSLNPQEQSHENQQKSSITLSVAFNGFKEWQQIKNNLTHIGGVAKLFVEKLEKTNAVISLHYSIPREAFLQNLNKHGFDLITDIPDSEELPRENTPHLATSMDMDAEQEDNYEERT